MKKVQFGRAISIKISEKQRRIIDKMAEREDMTLGSSTRLLIDAGIKALGISAYTGERAARNLETSV